ncbi:phytosulfokines 4-like [Phragmites australis]|uniref:phytosulfokines 4-like n=1 Tax=Phragmites australis TaxID=29695 RepID=UPI002D780C0E|nr:phytosulfokines 4-like [Phragmites australis]
MACKSNNQATCNSSVLVAGFVTFIIICTRGVVQVAARPEPIPSNIINHELKKHLQVISSTGATTATAGLGHKLGKLQGMKSTSLGQEEQEMDMTMQLQDCQGKQESVEEEYCLMMRRTLVAHTDYIYTQGKHN